MNTPHISTSHISGECFLFALVQVSALIAKWMCKEVNEEMKSAAAAQSQLQLLALVTKQKGSEGTHFAVPSHRYSFGSTFSQFCHFHSVLRPQNHCLQVEGGLHQAHQCKNKSFMAGRKNQLLNKILMCPKQNRNK